MRRQHPSVTQPRLLDSKDSATTIPLDSCDCTLSLLDDDDDSGDDLAIHGAGFLLVTRRNHHHYHSRPKLSSHQPEPEWHCHPLPTDAMSQLQPPLPPSRLPSPAQSDGVETREPSPMPEKEPSRQRCRRARPPEGAPLSRVGSTHSSHAGTSLRRMATHETGEYAVDDMDATSLHTHHEHDDEHDHDHLHDEARNRDGRHVPGSAAEMAERRRPDEEAALGGEGDSGGEAKKKNKYELQDQTNLLPVKQVIVIFCGLNCALFCSLLEQTM